MAGIVPFCLHEFDAPFADDGEDLEHVGEAEEVADLLAEVHEFEAAAGGFCGDVEADEGAEAHTVGVFEVGEIEDDAFGGGDEFGDGGVEDAGGSGDEAAVAVDYYGGADGFDVEGERRRGCGGGHGGSLSGRCSIVPDGVGVGEGETSVVRQFEIDPDFFRNASRTSPTTRTTAGAIKAFSLIPMISNISEKPRQSDMFLAYS